MTFKKIIFISIVIMLLLCGCSDYDTFTETVRVTLVPESEIDGIIIPKDNEIVESSEDLFESTIEETTVNEPHKIYRTKTGKSYHYDDSCGRGNYFECTLEEALADGLKPCKRCID